MWSTNYGCDCGHRWTIRTETLEARDPGVCPECGDTETASFTPAPGVLGNKSRALDMAQAMAEQDYGLTNIRDGQRQGDIAAMTPTYTQRENDDLVRQMKEYAAQTGAPIDPQPQAPLPTGVSWGNGPAAQIVGQTGGVNLSSPVKGTGEGIDPMAALHSGVRAGSRADLLHPANLAIMARTKST